MSVRTLLQDLKNFLFDSGIIRAGKTYYVDGVNGNNGSSGRDKDHPFLTMAYAFTKITDKDKIILMSKIQEQITTPLGVFDVTIEGASNRPKHDGGSANWSPKASPDAGVANLTIREQGWTIKNILFDAPADAACILIKREENATYPDGSHAIIEDNIFLGGQSGIEDIGGMHNCVIRKNKFEDLTNGIKTVSTGIAVPLQNIIEDNDFDGCENEIIISGSKCIIRRNYFSGLNSAGSANTFLVNTKAVSAQGSNNSVYDNHFNVASTVIDDGVRILGATGDYWSNFCNNNAARQVGIPAP